MEKANTNKNRFEEYLLKIEERENSLRRKSNLKLVVLMLTMIGGFIGYQHFQTNQKELERYALENLTPEKVTEMFAYSQEAVIVYHPEMGLDTVSSLGDYYEVLNRLDLIEMGRKVYMEAENKTSDTTKTAEKLELERYIVDVAGERQVGRKLIFTIEDYNPQLDYELDLGNGVIRNIKKTIIYKYPLPGHFDMKLTASDPQGRRESTYVKKYEIVNQIQTASNDESSDAATLVNNPESEEIQKETIVRTSQSGL